MLGVRALASGILLPAAVFAEEQQCIDKFNGRDVLLSWNPSDPAQAVTYRESTLRAPGRLWDWAWGQPQSCNGQVLLKHLGAALPAEEVAGQCLTRADDGGWLLMPGERNFNGTCDKTFCEVVNATEAEVTAMTGAIAGAAAGTTATTSAAGVSAVAHSSGALILTGNAGYVAGTLGTAGTGVIATLTAPATLAATAVTVVGVGGAVYICSE